MSKKIPQLDELTTVLDSDLLVVFNNNETQKVTKANLFQDVNDAIDDLNTMLSGKSDIGHIHDDRYYTETEVDDFLSGIGGLEIGGLVTGALAGSVLFAGAGGVLVQDNANFYRDPLTGKMGLGTNSPTAYLDIRGAAYQNINWGSAGALVGVISYGGSGAKIRGAPSFALSLGANDVDDYLYIKTNGNVGINTTNPGGRFHVHTTASDHIKLTGSASEDVGIWLQGSPNKLRIADWSTGLKGLNIDLTNGNVGIGTASPTALVDINSDALRLRAPRTPASSGTAGNQGDIAWDSDYLYVCIATNVWKRAALAIW